MTALLRCAAHLVLSACVVTVGLVAGAWALGPAQAGPTAMAGTLCTVPPAWGIQVIRSFCTGPAVLTLTLNGQTRIIKGGQCDHQIGMRSFNAGMMSITRAVSGAPDYVGFTVPEDGSTKSLAVIMGGKKYLFTSKAGAISDSGGIFDGAGNDIGPGQAHVQVHGSFTCGH